MKDYNFKGVHIFKYLKSIIIKGNNIQEKTQKVSSKKKIEVFQPAI